MKKLPRKLLSLLLALMLTAGAVLSAPLTANAADAQGKVYPTFMDSFYGDCGTDTTYYCFPDGSMAIFGTGAIADYSLLNGNTTAPWYKPGLDSQIQQFIVHKIFVEYGVTRIGDYSFYLSSSNSRIVLYNLDIANTVTSIGKYAFWGQALEEVIIPPTVTAIGENAFGNMSNLKRIVYYGKPSDINWDSVVTQQTEVHVLSTYADSLPSASNVTFSADLTDPYAGVDGKERNISAYYGSVNSHIFGGAAPYIITGKFDGVKKSVTYCNAGFATCVIYDNNYYALTDNSTGTLKYANINSQSHKITDCGDSIPVPLTLHITHEYVGPNTVKMIYTLKNTGDTDITGLRLGSAGDIKIGADDKATIKPIMEDTQQIGFYMKSGNADYDKTTQSGSEDYATLGFIGKNVLIDQNDNDSASAPATFFYGKVAANYDGSGAGAYTLTFYPEHIFNESSLSHETDDLSGVDSGMSFHWDNITVPANGGENQFAVLFSVYGSSGDEAQQTLIDDSQAKADDFVTVTWNLNDKATPEESTKIQQVVKKGETPVYPGATPIKPDDNKHYYLFTGWDDTPGPVQSDTTYIAQYDATAKPRLFRAHSISLHGDIALNFYLGAIGEGDVTEADLASGRVKVHFEWKVNDKIKTADVTLTSENRQVIDDKTYFVATCNVPAAEMAYNIHATAYVKKNGEWEQHWDNDRYSVKEYGMDLLNSSTATVLQKNMVRKMLYYGSMAQIRFDRVHADLGLADGELSQSELNTLDAARNAVTSGDIQTAVNNANPSEITKSDFRTINDLGLKYYGSSVIYLTTTTLRHYFKITDASQSGSWAAASNFTFAVDENYPTYYVHYDMKDIYASRLDDYQKFTFNGTDYYFSALDYSNAVLHSDKAPEAEKNLAKATYLYNQAANELFDAGQSDDPTPNP